MPPRKPKTIIPTPIPSDASTTPTKPSSSSNPSGPRTPNKIAAFALADKRRVVPPPAAGGSGGTPGRVVSGSFIMGGNGLAPPPLVVESQRYEEWMKLSTDNKITSTNTWNLALIDYFADMSLLRNGDGDNSINFQKASCTLDGCVKIWTSRVDSVATETGKLLSGLAEDGRSGGREDDEEDIEDGDDEAQEARAAKRKAARVASTLADNFAKIKVKAFDLEFTVDPLFKKTSADFDEGGAGGILMNHLGCDGNMKVVFDAGDAKLENNEEEDEESDDEEEVGAKLDISNLKRQFLPSMSSFSQKLLCPTLASFRFSPDAVLELDLINPVDVEITKPPPKNQHLQNQDDDMGGSGEIMDDYGGGGGNDDDMGGGGGNDWETGAADGGEDFFSETGGNAIGGSSTHFDNNTTAGGNGGGGGGGNASGLMEDRDLLMTMDGNGEQTFDFFDSSMATNGGLGNKNWTGPEHWKMSRKVVRKEDTATTAKQRKEKIAFSLDFTVPPLLSQKALFASGGPSTTLPRKIVAAPVSRGGNRRSSRPATVKEDDYTLPADFQFSSTVLLRLFLKPKTLLKMRRRVGGMNAPSMMEMTGEGQSDAQFWASNANNHAGNSGMGSMDDDDMGGMGDFFPEDDDGFVPFGTQAIFPDEDDEVPYFSENEDPDAPDDIRTTTEGLQRARPETVNHAKRATRVDVRRLKDSIWEELQVVTIPVKEFPKEAAYVYPSPNEPDYIPPSSEALVPVITGLRKLYPKDKMDEISTSFCFICLLHLANEKGLRIQTPASAEGSMDDGLLPRASVGGLEQLRVFRELTT